MYWRLECYDFLFISCVNMFWFNIQLAKKRTGGSLFLRKKLVFIFLPLLNLDAPIRCPQNRYTVFLTQIISRRQTNPNAKVVLSISRRQKWNSRRQFSKNCIFPNIQLKGFVNRLPPFKNLSDQTNRFLMG